MPTPNIYIYITNDVNKYLICMAKNEGVAILSSLCRGKNARDCEDVSMLCSMRDRLIIKLICAHTVY